MADTANACDKAIEILRRTNDGNDLAPVHLHLLQTAVNGWLTEEGEIAFDELYQSVLNGYKTPWFCDIEHLTIDHEGFLYWKNVPVEHYTTRWMTVERINSSAEELAARCRHLESIGVQPNHRTAVWDWEKYQPKETSMDLGKGPICEQRKDD
ncbi:MAG: hypothetical protein WC551_09805 [Patescibacteria group bacterium]